MPNRGSPTIRGATPAGPAVDVIRVGPGGAVAGAGGAAGGNGVDLILKQRILASSDPFSSVAISDAIQGARQNSVANLYLGMSQIQKGLLQVAAQLNSQTTPPQIIGVLKQPDNSAGALLQVQFNPSALGSNKPPVTTQTDETGAFTLQLPQGLVLPNAGLPLIVHGGNGNVALTIPNAQIGANGLVGAVPLPSFVQPLPVSILSALLNITAPKATPVDTTTTLQNPAQLPIVKVGEDDDSLLQFGANNSVDRFPYGVFFRLVEPRASIVTSARQVPVGNGRQFVFLPDYVAMLAANALHPEAPPPADPGNVSYVDRVPVEQPISVDGFRERIMGLKSDGTFTGDETVPMAGTLGLGYILWMAQRWVFQGVSLGDLVYSLPLAPGEQQQVAVFERTDTASVTESEFFTEEQMQQQSALADTSTNATFNSAFNETLHGSTSYQTQSSSDSWGGSILIVSGGGGSSSASGTSQSTLQGQRNTAQSAAEQTHSAAQNQAYARRSAARTGMRIATASESESVTTKVITNHNHTRALTLQYWEVLRLYDVATAIEGLTLACLVPLQVVRFLPPGQTLTLTDPSVVADPPSVLRRYEQILKHADVLAQALPRKYLYALNLLNQFASDPTATVEAFGGVAEDVINFTLAGTFLYYEDVYVTAVTKRNTRLGPVKLTNSAPALPPDTFSTQQGVIAKLREQRQSGSTTTLTGALALPQTMNRGDIVGFEISRNFKPVSYTLLAPEVAALHSLADIFGSSASWTSSAIASAMQQGGSAVARETITLSPADLETLGGPILTNFQASIVEASGDPKKPPSTENYANANLNGVELPTQPYPVPALQLGPVLRFSEILEIEKMAEHVARNTVTYSRAIWSSMSPEERAIMLEAYTIGVPPDGVTDASQMIPLLNCVENRVLGYYGNSMIMPFSIPEALAERLAGGNVGNGAANVDFGQIEDSLLAYQVAGFKPPHSIIALPTRGVLGEAVLGHSASAEKVDLTRFWNWQDSPSDTATQIQPVQVPTGTPSIAAGETAPNSLTNLPSLINNVLTAPSPDNTLLQAIAKDALGQKDFSTDITGATQLAGLVTNAQNQANAARADALKTTKDLNSLAIATAGNIVGGIYGGNPTAGSNALAAQNGQGGGSAQGQQKGQQQAKGGQQQQGGAGGPAGGGAKGGAGGGGDAGGGGGAGPAGGGGAGPAAGGAGGGGAGGGGAAPGPPAMSPMRKA